MIKLRIKAVLLIFACLLGLSFFPFVFALLAFLKYSLHLIKAMYLCFFVLIKGRIIGRSDKRECEILKDIKEAIK